MSNTPSTPKDTLCPAWLAGWAQRHPHWSACYLQADPRSLGLARIYLGLLLLADLLRRWASVSTWYSNEGLLPNHTLLWRPAADTQVSLFFTASTTTQASLLFALCTCVYFFFTIGYRTKFFHALSLVALVSLHGRTLFFEDGSEVTLSLLCTFAFFLPLGIRFSVDSLTTGLRQHKELRPEALADRPSFAGPSAPVTSLAVAAIVMQLVAIYFFNVAQKSGRTWHEGSAFHYVLHQDRIVTWLGQTIRPFVTPGLSKFVSCSALATEAALVLTLASPWYWKQGRRVALLLAIGLHAGFALFLNLGMFSFNMLGFFVVLITDEDWRLLARWFGPSPKRARVVYFDAGCGVCFALARWLARMDLFGLLILRANDSEDRPANLPSELIERTIVVDDPVSGGRWTQTAAFGQIFRALPGMAPLGWLLGTAPVLVASNPFYKLFAANRANVSTMLGMAACGIPGSKGVAAKPDAWQTPLHLWFATSMHSVRELVLVVIVVLEAIIQYPRLLEGWSMFAPDAPTQDQMIAVEAHTVDGRTIDPLAIASARVTTCPLQNIPERLSNDEFFCDYISKLPDHPEYFGAFQDWIFRHHERTGDAADRVVSFKAFVLRDESPLPGQQVPSHTTKTLMLEWNGR
jgi:predicted DCC family thiol-disulfide oxidoreductase YuxK